MLGLHYTPTEVAAFIERSTTSDIQTDRRWIRSRDDYGWIERLLLNLVDNAIKFTGLGGAIAVCVTRAGGAPTLAVHDSGIGIPAETLPHLFDRFIGRMPHDRRQSTVLVYYGGLR